MGEVFSLAGENPAIEGLTISKRLRDDNTQYIFSLAAGTDISGEAYDEEKLEIILAGRAEFRTPSSALGVTGGDALLTPTGVPVGTEAVEDTVYIEIELGRDTMVNEKVKAGEVFALKDLVPYRKDSIINLDVVHNTKMKFVVMAFDGGTALSEHAAPGDAIIFALEGEGIIGYEGKEYTIKEGGNFRFEKGGKHYVKADNPFKMALLLSFE